ncbi:uncharacterized protein LOC123449822 isoform X2 [Hordeum vulgare subsp. vulgare]|uniref:uncharacterized protein LOC123449822 isoform X2 n=1 Tax=Hordeum vulgare subsp. vulgare TaxID=112509 RepID=UPI001D1A501C|nr:uncharacterized protein LOC123449822 isoform X2 [Hordeum vulgare subsp. vulgare]
MGSLLGGWPSHNPQNFSQLVPADPSAQPTNITPTTYIAAHRTDPPPNQGTDCRVFHNKALQPLDVAVIIQEEVVQWPWAYAFSHDTRHSCNSLALASLLP